MSGCRQAKICFPLRVFSGQDPVSTRCILLFLICNRQISAVLREVTIILHSVRPHRSASFEHQDDHTERNQRIVAVLGTVHIAWYPFFLPDRLVKFCLKFQKAYHHPTRTGYHRHRECCTAPQEGGWAEQREAQQKTPFHSCPIKSSG